MRPVTDIVTLLELELGVRVYVRRLDSRISGLFAYDEALGPCVLLNASHPRERRNQTAGHEWGISCPRGGPPRFYIARKTENTREERYANAFGQGLPDARARRDAEIPRSDGRIRPAYPSAYHYPGTFLRRVAGGDGSPT